MLCFFKIIQNNRSVIRILNECYILFYQVEEKNNTISNFRIHFVIRYPFHEIVMCM